MSLPIILTVPHVNGIGKDDTAPLAADLIASFLDGERVLKASVPRHKCDQNRFRGRNCPMRRRLRPLLRRGVFVLDVHSFSRRWTGWRQSELVVLDNRRNWTAADEFHVFMRKRGADSQRINGQNNDIQEEAHELGVESFLLEFRDDLDPRRRRQLARWTAFWLKKWVARQRAQSRLARVRLNWTI